MRRRPGLRLKRAFDVAVVVALSPLLLPLGLIVSALVLVNLGRPILFSQRRPGLGGRLFTLYKFRTMRDAVGPDGLPLPDAARLTRFGRFLRSTSLDELPEIYCILRGEMSLVGPRPLLVEYLPLYTQEEMRRHEVLPGLTGWAQVNGRNALSWEDRFALDVWYVDNRSLLLDLKILFMTVSTVLKREQISHPGHETMPKFDRPALREAFE
jgi:lipopolysaccharide/colanic/teichoic acid biosynthesis glycosyltransferase